MSIHALELLDTLKKNIADEREQTGQRMEGLECQVRSLQRVIDDLNKEKLDLENHYSTIGGELHALRQENIEVKRQLNEGYPQLAEQNALLAEENKLLRDTVHMVKNADRPEMKELHLQSLYEMVGSLDESSADGTPPAQPFHLQTQDELSA